MPVTLEIEGHVYEVTEKFRHPGEGIRGQYLRSYDGRDATDEFDRFHFTDAPWEMLEKARDAGSFAGIRYVGPASPPPSTGGRRGRGESPLLSVSNSRH